MKLIKPKAELIEQAPGLNGIYKQIELAGRTCYKSEDKITGDSAKGFVDRMIKSNHCYTGDSEVLTNKCWIKWEDYQDQQVAVINSDLSFKGFETPSRVIKHTYTGTFYDYPTLGIKVTGGHKMFGLHRTGSNNFYNNQNYTLFECNALYKDQNGRIKTQGERMFKTPRHCSRPDYTNPYMELVGFWLGDGCYNEQIKNKLVFHLKKKRKIEYLKNLAKLLGYKFVEGKSNYYKIEEKDLGALFNAAYYVNGEKYINIEESFSTVDIHSIITGLINSDGSRSANTNTITYASTSKSIINWICTYAPLAGYTISYKRFSYQKLEKQKPCYKVLFLTTDYTINNDSRYKESKVIISKETHDVFCVTVSTGLIMVRGTNGITTICGNCAMLEHGTVYLWNPIDNVDFEAIRDKYSTNKYSAVKAFGQAITTNYRVIIENGWEEDLYMLTEPTEHHVKRYTFKVTTSIGVTRELNRHRMNSIAEQSTRYCNFSKSKFGNEVTFIRPSWFRENQLPIDLHVAQPPSENGAVFFERPYKAYWSDTDAVGYDWYKEDFFIHSCQTAEQCYFLLLSEGAAPQDAREVLPLCTATEAVYTAFESDWERFFDLRLRGITGKPHPNMLEIAELMHEQLKQKGVEL